MSKITLHEEIYNDIALKIQNNVYGAGDKIPTEFEIMERYEVSRTTAIRAVKDLEAAGLVYRQRRSGTFVSHKLNQNQTSNLVPIVLANLYHHDTIVGAQTRALERNLFVAPYYSMTDLRKEREILETLLMNKISGLILMTCSFDQNLDLISRFILNRVPVVFLDHVLPGISGVSVVSDNYKPFYELVNRLTRAGHRRIGYYFFHNKMLDSELTRFRAYCQALLDNGIPVEPDYIYKQDVNLDISYSQYHKFQQSLKKQAENCVRQFASLRNRPTAVCCTNDVNAQNLMQAAADFGLSAGALAITGFDNLEFAENISLTTVGQDFYAMGCVAVDAVSRLIDKLPYQTNYIVPAKIIVRNSAKI